MLSQNTSLFQRADEILQPEYVPTQEVLAWCHADELVSQIMIANEDLGFQLTMRDLGSTGIAGEPIDLPMLHSSRVISSGGEGVLMNVSNDDSITSFNMMEHSCYSGFIYALDLCGT